MRIKQKPEDFIVREAYRLETTRRGRYYVYRLDKQKLSTFEAIERIARAHRLDTSAFSFCGLKDKQGRTEQIIAVERTRVDMQDPDLRLTFIGRTDAPLSSEQLTANRFVVTVRDLSVDEAERVPESVKEVRRLGLVNYFDSQRFGGVKHGQGFLAKDLLQGRVENALKGYMAKPSRLDKTDDAKVKRFWAEHWGDWSARCPYPAVAKYRPVLKRLRDRPRDYAHAFQGIDRRYRALMLFEYQSYLWNAAVARYLTSQLGEKGHLALRYQVGSLPFPRSAGESERIEALKGKTFPLVSPESVFEDRDIERAVLETLEREKLTLEKLRLTAIPGMGLKHEERPLVVTPPKLSVVDPRPDELQPGRLKVTLAFTLPPGAYATLLVRRTMWFAMDDILSPGGPIPEPEPRFVPARVREQVEQAAARARSKRRNPKPSHGVAVEETLAAREEGKPSRGRAGAGAGRGPGRGGGRRAKKPRATQKKPAELQAGGRRSGAGERPQEAKRSGRKPSGPPAPADPAADGRSRAEPLGKPRSGKKRPGRTGPPSARAEDRADGRKARAKKAPGRKRPARKRPPER